MEEISIIIVLVLIITVYVIHDKQNVDTKCDKYVPYFDQMYYENMPKLRAISKSAELKTEKPESMQDLTTIKRSIGKCNDKSNVMKSRWSCYAGIFEKNTSGSNEYTNMDTMIDPTSLQKHLKLSKHEKMSASKYQVRNEQFADDGYYDPNFSYNEKYLYDENEETLNVFLDPSFNKPDEMDASNDGQINIPNAHVNPEFSITRPGAPVKPIVIVRPAVVNPVVSSIPARSNNLKTPVPSVPEVKTDDSVSVKADTPMVRDTDPKKIPVVVGSTPKPKSKLNPKVLKIICDRKKARSSSWW
jgi:hypothetical protein